MLCELAVVVEPARAGRDREVLGHVEAELAEHGNLLEFGVVTAQKPAFRGCEVTDLIVAVLQVVEIPERLRIFVAADEAVELGVLLLLAVERAHQPRPAALRIARGLQACLERRDLYLLIVGREAPGITAEVVYRGCA